MVMALAMAMPFLHIHILLGHAYIQSHLQLEYYVRATNFFSNRLKMHEKDSTFVLDAQKSLLAAPEHFKIENRIKRSTAPTR